MTEIVGVAATLAALVLYLGVERAGLAALPLALLRAVAWGCLAALVVNPACRRARPAGTTVLLDHSLSMEDPGGGETRWRKAVDSARAIAAGRGGGGGRVILFGGSPSDLRESVPPPAGPRSLLLPAWREALARGGPVAIVTDGEVGDVAALPSDPLARARIVVLPRPSRPDVGILSFDLPRTLRAGDTGVAALELVVSRPPRGPYQGTWPAAAGLSLELSEAGRVLARQRVGATLLRADIRFVPSASSSAAERELRRYSVRLAWPRGGDAEPRNDVRVAYAEVVRAADVVMVSDRPDWDFRFAGAVLAASAGSPVRSFVRVEDAGWRESRTARPVSDLAVRRAVAAASLVLAHGTLRNLEAMRRLARRGLWLWPTEGLREGDWYVSPLGPASALGDVLAGVPAESLPPLAALAGGAAVAASDSAAWTAIGVRLGRRGEPRPAVTGWEVDGRRVVLVSGLGFYRWVLKGGLSAQGFRALAVGLTDWLIGSLASGDSAEVVPLARTVTRGEPLRFVRGPGPRGVKREGRAVYTLIALPPEARALRSLVFESPADTVEAVLPPGTYRLPGSSGEVTVEEFSPEFLPRERALGLQPGFAAAGERESVPLRHTRWPYLAAVVALCLEWVVRRRRGLR